MLKITMHGYFGFDNIGDEAILYSMIQGIKSINENSRITVLSSSPEKTSRRYNVHSISRVNFWRIMGSLRKSQLFISGGGSLLQDVTSFYSPLYYLFVMQLAARFAKKSVFAFQGFGPLKSKILRKLTVNSLTKMDEISVRDEKSRAKLVQMGLPEERVRKIFDPVFLLTPEKVSREAVVKNSDENNEDINSRYNLGVAVRPWGDNKYLQEVITAVNRFIEEYPEFKLTLIPLHYESDIKSVRKVKNNLSGRDMQNIKVVSPIEHPREITDIFSKLDLLLGVRLHSLIFATLLGVPCVGIEYDPKIPAFLSQLELEPAGKTEEISARKIYNDLVYYWNNRNIISSKQRNFALACKQEIESYLERLINIAQIRDE